MAGYVGADPAALRQLAQQVEGAANQLTSLAGQLSTLVAEAQWLGVDADELAGEWDSFARAALLAAAETLTGLGVTLQRNATEQERASQADPGPTADTGRPGGRERDSDTGRPGGSERDSDDERDRRDPGPDRRDDDGGDPGTGVPGAGAGYPGGLGPGVPGTSVPKPEVPPWSPPDEGAGEHGSDWALPDDYLTHAAARAGADLKSGDWPHAADNLDHYLDNSGDDRAQNIDEMLNDCPQLNAKVNADVDNIALNAVAQAKASGATSPVTYPISTDWQGHYINKSESADWFYATGGMAYSVQGQVTVYPPETPGGEWRYETDSSVSYRDRYNWDGDKSTDIGPLTVTDDQLAELHRAGIAKEYNMTGESSNHHTSGTG